MEYPNKKQIEFLNKNTTYLPHCESGWKYNTKTKRIDIDGNWSQPSRSKDGFRGIEFGVISRNFYCSCCDLKSFKGAPTKVHGDFIFCHNPIDLPNNSSIHDYLVNGRQRILIYSFGPKGEADYPDLR